MLFSSGLPVTRQAIKKPLQGMSPATAFLGHCQADRLKGVEGLHDFNPPKRFRQRAER